MKKINQSMKKLICLMKKFDYRHYICAALMIVSILLAIFRFKYALPRIFECFIDIYNSFKFYLSKLFNVNLYGRLTILDLSKMPFELPFNLPLTLEEFKLLWSRFWDLFVSSENFNSYFSFFGDLLLAISKLLMIGFPFVLIYIIFSVIKSPKVNNDRNKESRALKTFKRIEDNLFLPILNWFKGFIEFLKLNRFWWQIWAFIWAYNFNFIAIVLELIAFYFYFIANINFADLYIQVIKLLMDLSVLIDFVPRIIRICFYFYILHILVRHIGYKRLYRNENRNRCFLNDRGVSFIIDGEMGTGKTQMNMDMSLSLEVEYRERALDIILEINMLFPNFPWVNFEDSIKSAIKNHDVFTLFTCEEWINSKYLKFEKNPSSENIWNYDINRYPLSFYNNLEEESIWNCLLDYCKAYLIYTIECSLILSNYSIRTDGICSDIGNFPLWDYDFFKRDKNLVDKFSQRCHILDFDLLRLGTQMLRDNPNRNALGYGIYVVTELDKELKNTQTLKEVKSSSKECNQKNDLTHECIKMLRHVATVRNRNFINFTGEMQRCESLGIDVRGLGEVIHIDKKEAQLLTLPFFAPYYLFSLLYDLFFERYSNKYIDDKYNRGDSSLFRYILTNIASLGYRYKQKTCNLYGYRQMNLTIERGRSPDECLKKKYFIQNKKTYSSRYTTDCMSSIFKGRAKDNEIGLSDIRTYSNLMAMPDELELQNSHTQEEYKRLRNNQK